MPPSEAAMRLVCLIRNQSRPGSFARVGLGGGNRGNSAGLLRKAADLAAVRMLTTKSLPQFNGTSPIMPQDPDKRAGTPRCFILETGIVCFIAFACCLAVWASLELSVASSETDESPRAASSVPVKVARPVPVYLYSLGSVHGLSAVTVRTRIEIRTAGVAGS